MTRSRFGRQHIQTTNGNQILDNIRHSTHKLDIHKPPSLALMLGTLHFGTEFILTNGPLFWDDCI
jgi:hypothetical protein